MNEISLALPALVTMLVAALLALSLLDTLDTQQIIVSAVLVIRVPGTGTSGTSIRACRADARQLAVRAVTVTTPNTPTLSEVEFIACPAVIARRWAWNASSDIAVATAWALQTCFAFAEAGRRWWWAFATVNGLTTVELRTTRIYADMRIRVTPSSTIGLAGRGAGITATLTVIWANHAFVAAVCCFVTPALAGAAVSGTPTVVATTT